MRGHAPPCRLLGQPAFQLRLPSIHRTADKTPSSLDLGLMTTPTVELGCSRTQRIGIQKEQLEALHSVRP